MTQGFAAASLAPATCAGEVRVASAGGEGVEFQAGAKGERARMCG